MNNLHHYDPKLVKVFFLLAPISGFAEDAFIECEESDDPFTLVGGVDGDFTRTKNNSVSLVSTFNLMQTSKSNAFLSAAHLQDRESDGGAGIGGLLITDLNGVSVVKAGQAWIELGAAPNYAKNAGPRSWKIRAIDYKIIETGT